MAQPISKMETTQTAVDWLITVLVSSSTLPIKTINDFIEHAKAMEKKQIIDAWIATDNELQRISAEKYYNETYQSNKH